MGSTWTVGYVYANGQLVAQYKDSTTYAVRKDHLGSTRLLTKAGGTGFADDSRFFRTDQYKMHCVGWPMFAVFANVGLFPLA